MKHRTSKLQKEIIGIIQGLQKDGYDIDSKRIYRLLLWEGYENKRSLSASLCRSLKSLKERGIIDYKDSCLTNQDEIKWTAKNTIKLLKVNCSLSERVVSEQQP